MEVTCKAKIVSAIIAKQLKLGTPIAGESSVSKRKGSIDDRDSSPYSWTSRGTKVNMSIGSGPSVIIPKQGSLPKYLTFSAPFLDVYSYSYILYSGSSDGRHPTLLTSFYLQRSHTSKMPTLDRLPIELLWQILFPLLHFDTILIDYSTYKESKPPQHNVTGRT